MADSAGRACRMQLLRAPKSGCRCRRERAARSCHVRLSWEGQRCRRKLLPVFVFVVDLALIIPRCARPFWSFGPAQLWSSPAFRSASQSLNPGLRPKSLVASLGCPYMPDGSCECRVRCDAATTLALTTTDADALRALPLHRPCLGRPAEQWASCTPKILADKRTNFTAPLLYVHIVKLYPNNYK